MSHTRRVCRTSTACTGRANDTIVNALTSNIGFSGRNSSGRKGAINILITSTGQRSVVGRICTKGHLPMVKFSGGNDLQAPQLSVGNSNGIAIHRISDLVTLRFGTTRRALAKHSIGEILTRRFHHSSKQLRQH